VDSILDLVYQVSGPHIARRQGAMFTEIPHMPSLKAHELRVSSGRHANRCPVVAQVMFKCATAVEFVS